MKVLVISHNSFSTTHNNGKTLSAIFSAFEKEELCQLYFTPIGYLDKDRCLNYYLISDKDAIKSIIFRCCCGTIGLRDVINTEGEKINVKVNDFTRFLRTIIWYLSSWYRGGLNKWLRCQSPDVIFYVGGDAIFSHRIAFSLSKKLGVPLVSYFTDDYIVNPKMSIYTWILKYYYSKTVNHSSLLFAIGEKMADVYSNYFHRKFLPIMNIVDIPLKAPCNYFPHDILRINYFGGVHLGRGDEILRFAQFVRRKLEPKLHRKVIIGLYSFATFSEDIKKKFQMLGVKINKGLFGQELKKAMQETDIFLHVESVFSEYKSLTMLSVSTKIPEYMSMAKPIIAFGPSDVASFDVLTKASDLLVINDNDENLANQSYIAELANILNSDKQLSDIGKANSDYAIKNFDREKVAKAFQREIDNIVNKSTTK